MRQMNIVLILTICASALGPVRGGPAGAASGEEPSDAEVFEAVVSSMRRYYERRGQTKRGPQSLVRRKRDEEVVCYSELGCFRDEGPFDYLDTLPQAPELIGTQFLLYTRANPEAHLALHYANISSLYTPLFNRSHPVKVMVHGFGSSCQKQWAVEMRSALFQLSNVNVICVNWEEGASLPNYVQAAANTRLVGKQLAKFIRVLNGVRGTNTSAFHLIGFSLGAHVAGFAGDEVRNLSRITGLDPAAPLFEGYSPQARLDPSDALFVDVIHSNGESLLYGGLGAFEPMGHVDYYPNGGKEQGGCSNIFVGAISDLIWYQSKKEGGRSLCNHRRAYKFFADSIVKACHFPAFACPDFRSFLHGDCFDCAASGCANMGYYADRSAQARGKFYLLTRDDEPFCANQFKVVIESSMGLSPTYGALELTLINWNMRNETFQLNPEGEQLLPGRPLSTVIVAHPFMNNPVSARIRYMPYKGWMTNGLERWAVDRITVISSAGQKYSFCHRGLPLAEGKPASVLLSPKHCSQDGPPPSFRPLKMKPVSLDEDAEESNVIPTSGPRNLSKPYVSSKIIYGKKAHQGGPTSAYAPPPGPHSHLQQQQELSSRAGHERTLVRPWRPYPGPHSLPVRRSGSSFSFRSAKTFPHQEDRHFRLVQWVPEARAQIVFIPKRIEEHFIPLRHAGHATLNDALAGQHAGRRLKDVLKRLPEFQIL